MVEAAGLKSGQFPLNPPSAPLSRIGQRAGDSPSAPAAPCGKAAFEIPSVTVSLNSDAILGDGW